MVVDSSAQNRQKLLQFLTAEMEPLNGILRALLSDLRELADGLIYFAIAVLPWLVIIALLVYAGVRIYRAIQRRR